MSERIDDPTFKAYDQAIKEVYDKDTFSFGGFAYEKSGGSTFLKTDQVPGGAVEFHPNAAAEIDAKRLDDATTDYKRQEYLRKRDEWHNTPDTPEAPEMYHRHDAPPPDPDAKKYADKITDGVTVISGGILGSAAKQGAEEVAKRYGMPKVFGSLGGATIGSYIDEALHDGWYNLSPHKDL